MLTHFSFAGAALYLVGFILLVAAFLLIARWHTRSADKLIETGQAEHLDKLAEFVRANRMRWWRR